MPDVHDNVIEKRGGEWCVLSEDRQTNLGCFPSEAEARERLRQVEAAKAARGLSIDDQIAHWANLQTPTKTEDGVAFPPGDFAYVPDRDTPSTWKLRLTDEPGGPASRTQVGQAIAAIGKGFRGNRVQIPSGDRRAVMRRLRAAWRASHDEGEEMPDVLRRDTFGDDDPAREYANLSGVEIFRTGKWNGDEYTTDDLDDMVDAFDKAGFQVPVKLGHEEKSGDPAFGWVSALRRQGDRLVADFRDLPERLAKAIRDRRFDHVSAEIFWNLKRGGQKFRRALKAVALLGAEMPAVAGLKPLREAKFDYDEGEVHLATADLKESGMSDKKKIAQLTADLEAAQADLAAAEKAKDEAKAAEAKARVAELRAEKAEAEAAKLREDLDEIKKSKDSAVDPVEFKKMTERVEAAEKQLAETRERARQEANKHKVEALSIPSLRPHFAAMYDLATADPERTVKFKFADQKDEADTDPVKVLDDAVARLNKHAERNLFSEVSRAGPFGERPRAPAEDDPGDEVHRLVQAKMAEDKDLSYAQAMEQVQRDPDNRDLIRRYVASGN